MIQIHIAPHERSEAIEAYSMTQEQIEIIEETPEDSWLVLTLNDHGKCIHIAAEDL